MDRVKDKAAIANVTSDDVAKHLFFVFFSYGCKEYYFF